VSPEAWTAAESSTTGGGLAGRPNGRSAGAAGTASAERVDGDHPHVRNGPALAAISRRVVALLKEYAGKGPVKARTYYWGDLLVVMLSGGYTTLEQTLLSDGLSQPVVDQRTHFNEAMRPRFTRIVEQELGRGVLACMDASHHEPDFNAKVFVLAPVPIPDDASPQPGETPGKTTSDNGASE
jgi:uncharacterized protein YbcI